MPAVVNDISEDTLLGPRRDPTLDPEPSPRPGPTLGELLRTRREAKGLTPHQAAGQLRLVPTWIEAFESNRFDALGAPVYARGYLRKYALLLELPPDEILAKYDQLIDVPAPPPLAPIKSTGTEPVTTSRGPTVIGGVALVAVAAALIIGITQSDQPAQATADGQPQTAAATIEQPAESPAPLKVAAASETSPASTENAAEAAPQTTTSETVREAGATMTASAEPPAATTTEAPPSTTTEPVTTQVAASEAVDDAESAAAAAAAEDPEQPLARVAVPPMKGGRDLKIKLSFKGKSWTTVYAADGTRLLYELSRRGRPRTVSSPAPLTVVFGAIDAVEMRVNDKSVTIPRQPGKDSIKFVLDVEDAQAGTRSADTGG